jgi:1-acyl-sn-glycerol-3-phosphate acyltransferase
MKGAGSDPANPASAFYRVCDVLVRTFATTFFQWRVYHAERVPPTGPVILASNHVSFGDPPLIGGAVPRPINYLARESLFRQPAFARLIRSLNAVPVDREGGGPGGVRTVLELLGKGRAVLIFPEGTRSRDGALLRAHPGIGLVVLRSGAPVVPVRLFGLYEAWGRHQLLPRPGPIAIKFGEPLRFEALRAEAATASKPRTKIIYEEIANELMAAMGRLEPCRDVQRFPEVP